MKDAFKKGFGVVMGIYCGCFLVEFIGECLKPKSKELEKEDYKDEESN